VVDPSKWSDNMNELVAACLVKSSAERPTAEVLEEVCAFLYYCLHTKWLALANKNKNKNYDK